jgi:hypothetical protein
VSYRESITLSGAAMASHFAGAEGVAGYVPWTSSPSPLPHLRAPPLEPPPIPRWFKSVTFTILHSAPHSSVSGFAKHGAEGVGTDPACLDRVDVNPHMNRSCSYVPAWPASHLPSQNSLSASLSSHPSSDGELTLLQPRVLVISRNSLSSRWAGRLNGTK